MSVWARAMLWDPMPRRLPIRGNHCRNEGQRVTRVWVALAALPLLIACDGGLADRPDLGAPEEWELGPFEQGQAITVPANPCPAETTSVITAADGGVPTLSLDGGGSIDDPRAFDLMLGLDAPVGGYVYVVACRVGKNKIALFEWDVRVLASRVAPTSTRKPPGHDPPHP